MLRAFDFDAAVAALARAVAEAPEYDEALINLGIAHYMRGDSEDAIGVYRRVLARNPDNGFARYSLGVAFLEDQRLGEAEVEIRRALELDPNNAMAHNTLGVLLLDQHFITGARAAMRRAADLGTLSAPVFYSNYAFASLYEPDVSNGEILEIHREYGRRYATAASPTGAKFCMGIRATPIAGCASPICRRIFAPTRWPTSLRRCWRSTTAASSKWRCIPIRRAPTLNDLLHARAADRCGDWRLIR